MCPPFWSHAKARVRGVMIENSPRNPFAILKASAYHYSMPDQNTNPYESASTMKSTTPWWSSFLRRRPKLDVEPQRLLDDIAQAVHQTRSKLILRDHTKWAWFAPRVKRRIVRSLLLDDQFSSFSNELYWPLLWKEIGCDAPTCWDSFTIQLVADHIVATGNLGERVPAGEVSTQQWVNAQIFAGVQRVIIEQCGIRKEDIYRSAHFFDDLDCC